MYALLLRNDLLVLHTHSDAEILADIACIECPLADYHIFPIDTPRYLVHLTDYELKLLYRNLTNLDLSNFYFDFTRQQSMQIVFDALNRIPETTANKFEADRQANYVEAHDPHGKYRWTYAHTATVPAQQPDLFELTCKTTPRSEESEKNAKAGKLPAMEGLLPTGTHSLQRAQPVSPPAATKAAVNNESRPQPAHRDPAPTVKVPRRGTAKGTIYAVADELWEKEGKPKDKSEILKLRKRIMDILETDHGIKRGSSSNTLAGWHKERAPY